MNYETLIGITITQFLLGFVRASGLVATAPLYHSKAVPAQIKVLLAGALAIAAGPYIGSDLDLQSFGFWSAVTTLTQEAVIGLIMGLMANLVIYGIQLAGYFFDIQLGFGMVNIIDPQSGMEMPLLGQFNFILASLIYLAIDGHHTLIIAFIKSFDIVQPGMFFFKKEAAGVFVQAFAEVFFLGFKIAIPVIGTIFLVDVALGIIAKLVPQINVFMIGFPIKILLGLFVLAIFIPTYVFLIEQSFAPGGSAFKMVRLMLRQLSGT